MSLINLFKQEAIKQKKPELARSSRTPLGFPTGLDLLDFKNGMAVYPDGHKPYMSLGITEGTYVMWIGASGSGKTTVALQSAFEIIKPYEKGVIFHYDLETATTKSRVKKLTGASNEYLKEHYFHKDTGITSENFYETIRMISKLKQENREEYEVHTGRYDEEGEEIVILAPTVMILDSLPLLVPEKITEEEELSGQMSRTSAAKMNAAVFRQILPELKKSNIILYVIKVG